MINEATDMQVFSDSLAPYVARIKKLPFAAVNVLITYMKDIRMGIEKVDDPYREILVCYFVLGILLSKENINLFLSEKQFNELKKILKELTFLTSTLDNTIEESMFAELIDGEWHFGITERGEKIIEEISIKNENNKM